MNILNLLNKNQYRIVKLAKGSTLFKEGSVCNSVGIIIEGKLKISSFLIDGKEIVYNELLENEVFGNNLVFSSNPIYKGDLVALIDSKIALITKNELIHILSTNKEFLVKYLEIQSNFSKKLNDKIKLLSIDSAIERLYYFLYINKNEVSFSSVQELAKQLNLSREATSRLISKLVKEKKIKRTKNTIIMI